MPKVLFLDLKKGFGLFLCVVFLHYVNCFFYVLCVKFEYVKSPEVTLAMRLARL